MTKAETIFAHELNLIHDTTIRDFVTTCFDKLCPDYFWTCPCSTTGKYHPQVSLGVGGLVRHTKLAVWWGLELMQALGTTPELVFPTIHDEVIATLLLHDMIKNGKGLNAQGYPLDRGVTGTHGVALAKKMLDLDAGEGVSTRILAGIAGHMGVWTTDVAYRPENMESSDRKAFAQLIHLADYCASRKVDSIYSELTKEKNADIVDRTCENCKENENDLNKESTEQITEKSKNGTSKSPACPGVRKTESCQTDSETDSQ